MSSSSLKKHSACQRCRSMKLRCPARENNAASCGRCLRLKVTCVAAASSHSTPDLTGQTRSSNPSRDMNSIPSLSSEPDLLLWKDSVRSQNGSQSFTSNIGALSLFGIPIPSDYPSSGDSASFDESGQHDFTPTELELFGFSHYKDLSLNVDEPANVSPFAPTLTPGTIHFDQPNAISSINPSMSVSSTELTGLRLSLSQKRHRARVARSNKNTSSPSGSLDEDADPFTLTGTPWVEEALQDIARFLGIIETYSQQTCSASNFGGSVYQPTISITIASDILSAYLEIIAIFENLCAHLYGNLRASSQGSISDIQTLPGLQLAGISIGYGQLQTKILLQVVVHHFEMIEKVLGLPVTYRISGRVNEYDGLLNNQRYSRLMGIVMEDENGKRSRSSLRQNLRSMAELIYI